MAELIDTIDRESFAQIYIGKSDTRNGYFVQYNDGQDPFFSEYWVVDDDWDELLEKSGYLLGKLMLRNNIQKAEVFNGLRVKENSDDIEIVENLSERHTEIFKKSLESTIQSDLSHDFSEREKKS